MFQTDTEVIAWINGRLKFGIKPGLERMEWLMEKLDNPERLIRMVHIGGTNGKGSTTTYLRYILQEAGYEVGTFTSPYFEKFHERISINGQPISSEDLIEVANIIQPLVNELGQTDLGQPTEFEIITAMCFYYFGKVHPVDIALIEVGLGGRLDSTNIIHPILSIITSIGHDHMHILGNSLEEIAAEKAGIIKSGVPLVTAVRDSAALSVIENVAKQKNATIYKMNEQFSVQDTRPENGRESFSYQSLFQGYSKLEISMLGEHQIENAAVSVMAAQVLKTYFSFLIDTEHIKKGLVDSFWPGRFERVTENPLTIIDGAHNMEGIQSFLKTIKRHFPTYKGTILFTALKDKPLQEMIELLDTSNFHLAFTEFDFPRASKAEDLYDLSRSVSKEIVKDWKLFLEKKVEEIQENEALIITGSLYFISEVRPYLMKFI